MAPHPFALSDPLAQVTALEAQLVAAASYIQSDIGGLRKAANVEKRAAATANGRAAAAELEVVSLRTRLKSMEEAMEAAKKASEATAAAAREAHAGAMAEVREAAVRERERHSELVEALRAELSSNREAHAAAMGKAEEARNKVDLACIPTASDPIHLHPHPSSPWVSLGTRSVRREEGLTSAAPHPCYPSAWHPFPPHFACSSSPHLSLPP